MGALDRAFLKAYHKGLREQSRSVRRAPRITAEPNLWQLPSEPSDSAAGNSIAGNSVTGNGQASVASPAPTNTTGSLGSTSRARVFGQAHAASEPPAPHANFSLSRPASPSGQPKSGKVSHDTHTASTTAAAGAGSAPRTARRIDLAHEVVAPAGTRSLADAAARVSAAYEVEQFNWPRLSTQWLTTAADACRSFGRELAQRSQALRKVVAVVGTERGVGCSSVAITVARLAALSGLKVALIDADFRSPQLADHFGVEPIHGWEAVLQGRQALAEAMIESLDDAVTLVPLLEHRDHVPASAAAQAAASLALLRGTSHLVLLDLGPLDTDIYALELAQLLHNAPLDDALVVCRAASATASASVAPLERRLAALGLRRWDLVENFAPRG